MANDPDYIKAAEAVASGTADAEQVRLNNKMASQSRTFSPLVQLAQDAKVEAAKANKRR